MTEHMLANDIMKIVTRGWEPQGKIPVANYNRIFADIYSLLLRARLGDQMTAKPTGDTPSERLDQSDSEEGIYPRPRSEVGYWPEVSTNSVTYATLDTPTGEHRFALIPNSTSTLCAICGKESWEYQYHWSPSPQPQIPELRVYPYHTWEGSKLVKLDDVKARITELENELRSWMSFDVSEDSDKEYIIAKEAARAALAGTPKTETK